MYFVEVQATVRSDKRVWLGEGFWPLPDGHANWDQLVNAIAQAVMRGVVELLKGNDFRLELSGQSLELKGAVADKVADSCKRWPADSREQMTWQERGPRYGR